MTLEFNRRLKAWIAESGVDYMDFDLCALDEETGLVGRSLLNKHISVHHYDAKAFYEIIRNVIGILR